MFEFAKFAHRPEEQQMTRLALRNESFRRLWENKYFLKLPAIRELMLYPKDSLGYQYAAHMLQNNLSPTLLRIALPESATEFLSFLTRQTHDIWHVVTGYDTSLVGETALQAFYAAQVKSPLAVHQVARGLLELTQKNSFEVDHFFSAVSEAFLRGKKCQFLLGVRWENYLETSTDRIRAEVGL